MSDGDRYFTAPLAVLRSGRDVLEALENLMDCGIVSAGLGHRTVHGHAEFEKLVTQARSAAAAAGQASDCPAGVPPHWCDVVLGGAHLLGVRNIDIVRVLEGYQQFREPGQVFFRMRDDWVWNAMLYARNQAGDRSTPYDKPFTWRELRLIAALLSAPVNRHDFTFLGWESIQARACGYHSKALFRAALAGETPSPEGARTLMSASASTPPHADAPPHALPAHCQPLSRDVIRHDLDKLEALGFFGRCRYARGPCGGYTAYTFRHRQRADLLAAVQAWATDKNARKTKIAANRQEDLRAFRKALPARAERRSAGC